MKKHPILFLLSLFILTACNSNSGEPQQNITPLISAIPANIINSTQLPVQTTPTNTPLPTPVLLNQICSPLQDETLADLPQIITQPFKMPPLGFDYDHQGVDFSYYRRNGHIGILGLPVYASLAGKVISVLKEKWVYGNAVIIETPLDQIPVVPPERR